MRLSLARFTTDQVQGTLPTEFHLSQYVILLRLSGSREHSIGEIVHYLGIGGGCNQSGRAYGFATVEG
jgi:hypothetical protein